MFFIGVITNQNSENNIKNIVGDKFNGNEIIFLNNENLKNFRNVQFDSIIVNENINDENILENILKKSKYILWNSDIHCKYDSIQNVCSNVITYGYNSKATVTISSATDDCYMIFVQNNLCGNNKLISMQEIKFEKNKKNINAYDGMIITIIKLIYDI